MITHHDQHEQIGNGARPVTRTDAARKGVETRRARAKTEAAVLLANLEMRPIPERTELTRRVVERLYRRHGQACASEKALCSYIRHKFTSYDAILRAVKGRVGATDLRMKIKVYLCYRIIETYGLELDPLIAAGYSAEQAGSQEIVAGIIQEFGLRE